MKKLIIPILLFFAIILNGQPIIIDHNCIDLSQIPDAYIDSAKAELHIGYGHTSHGSQITTGMDALESYFTNGKYDWSHDGGNGELQLFEGSGYDEGYLDHDAGYSGWDTKTRTFLADFPACNVIMWSWCGQVNDVNLTDHYLNPMQQLEDDYPGVKFVYMTGHLEGLGPDGSLNQANQQIRNHCITNNKILFDFADIETYAPYYNVNLLNYFANDECLYDPDGAEPVNRSENWADTWLEENPTHQLAEISAVCGDCAHSEGLNCVKKGIAIWYLWAQLAGWEGIYTAVEKQYKTVEININPNPIGKSFTIILPETFENAEINIIDLQGKIRYTKKYVNVNTKLIISDLEIPEGMYILTVSDGGSVYKTKLIK